MPSKPPKLRQLHLKLEELRSPGLPFVISWTFSTHSEQVLIPQRKSKYQAMIESSIQEIRKLYLQVPGLHQCTNSINQESGTCQQPLLMSCNPSVRRMKDLEKSLCMHATKELKLALEKQTGTPPETPENVPPPTRESRVKPMWKADLSPIEASRNTNKECCYVPVPTP